jgi:hypothetical protein
MSLMQSTRASQKMNRAPLGGGGHRLGTSAVVLSEPSLSSRNSQEIGPFVDLLDPTCTVLFPVPVRLHFILNLGTYLSALSV